MSCSTVEPLSRSNANTALVVLALCSTLDKLKEQSITLVQLDFLGPGVSRLESIYNVPTGGDMPVPGTWLS